jgi:hypothetical protein
MAPLRSAPIRLFPTLLHALLCFVVLMQMLGAPISLWHPDVPGDLVKASLLEGFSLVPGRFTIPPTSPLFYSVASASMRPSILLSDSLFRPPSRQRPPMPLV